MTKIKRVSAMIGVVLLALLYLSTLVFALLGKDYMHWLMAAVTATIMLPVLIWAFGFIYGLIKGNREEEE